MRALKSYGVAFVLLVLVGAWMSTGMIIRGGYGPVEGEKTVVSFVEKDGGKLTDAVESSGLGLSEHHVEGLEDPNLTIAERNALLAKGDGQVRSVRVKNFNIQAMKLDVTLRGNTASKASVRAVSQTSDIVASVAVTDGQKISKGDPVCTLDAGLRQASVDQAQASVAQANASLAQAQANFNTNKNLREKGLASANSADAIEAGLRAAEAGLEAASVGLRNAEKELGNTEIFAPISGIVQRPIAEAGDLLNFGSSCATIVQLDPLVFVGAVPQARITLARLGMKADIRTITEQKARGEISFIAVSADPATRTFAIEIEFPNPDGKIFVGLTSEAVVDMGSIPAHLLPQSVLLLDESGNIGVQTVESSKVVYYPLTILADARDGVWVTGLPLSVDVIVLGQEYVTDGQVVEADHAE